METNHDEQENSPIFLLPATANISCVVKVLEDYRTAIEKSNCLDIDGSEVSVIDAAFLQLLVMMVSNAQEKGLKFAWTAYSDVLCEGAKLTGLTKVLHLNTEN